ncbi:hypothetical protein BCEN4_1100003 [Burkholderia cenocepacia]|nr:hypothetical protein BCEN4_1100003 [Burkholderia cenocepacia]
MVRGGRPAARPRRHLRLRRPRPEARETRAARGDAEPPRIHEGQQDAARVAAGVRRDRGDRPADADGQVEDEGRQGAGRPVAHAGRQVPARRDDRRGLRRGRRLAQPEGRQADLHGQGRAQLPLARRRHARRGDEPRREHHQHHRREHAHQRRRHHGPLAGPGRHGAVRRQEDAVGDVPFREEGRDHRPGLAQAGADDRRRPLAARHLLLRPRAVESGERRVTGGGERCCT